MELEILHEGICVGSAQVTEDGLYWKIDAACKIAGSDVHRLWAHGENASVRLGVLIPNGERLCLSKRLPASTIRFTDQTVISTQETQLPPFSGSIGTVEVKGAYLLERDGKRTLCIPYRDEPFLLMEYICFFRLERVDGRLFWMTELDGANFPVFC